MRAEELPLAPRGLERKRREYFDSLFIVLEGGTLVGPAKPNSDNCDAMRLCIKMGPPDLIGPHTKGSVATVEDYM